MKRDPLKIIKEWNAKAKIEILAGIPEVGIFWIDGNQLHVGAKPWTMGAEYGEYVQYPEDHYSYWRKIKRYVKGYENADYEELPRGRVLMEKKEDGRKEFIVYLPTKFKNDEGVKRLIRKEFSLNPSNTTFETDLHYDNYEDIVPIEEEEEYWGI